MKNDGGYVYPFKKELLRGEKIQWTGITRRDWLAGLAMQGILTKNSHIQMIVGGNLYGSQSNIETISYAIADAMIAEGRKHEKEC